MPICCALTSTKATQCRPCPAAVCVQFIHQFTSLWILGAVNLSSVNCPPKIHQLTVAAFRPKPMYCKTILLCTIWYLVLNLNVELRGGASFRHAVAQCNSKSAITNLLGWASVSHRFCYLRHGWEAIHRCKMHSP